MFGVSGNFPSTSPTAAERSRFREIPTEDQIRSEFESIMSEESEGSEGSEGSEECEESVVKDSAGSANRHPRDRSSSSSPENVDEIILSMIWSNEKLGAAYYDIATSELFVMEDTEEELQFPNIMRALYRQCRPRYILTTSGSACGFINALEKLIITGLSNEEGKEDGLPPNAPSMTSSSSIDANRNLTALRVMPKRDHTYERCFHRVRCLKLASEPENASNVERLIYLNSLLNFKCHAMVHALGLLLIVLDKQWNNITLEPSGRAEFRSLNYVTLRDLVTVDEDSYKALNIVEPKHHPSPFKLPNTSTNTQGLCLFAFLNRCRSRPGVQCLWKTLHHPTRDLRVLNERLNAIEYFLKPTNQSIVENLLSCLSHVSRITNNILNRCSGTQSRASDWYRIHKTVSHVIYIADICESQPGKVAVFEKITAAITNEIRYIKYFIEYIVDFEGSKRENNFVVKSNVDPMLDELNHIRSNLPQLLTQMGEKDMKDHLPASVAGCNMVYLPNIGYVLAIKEWNTTPPDDMIFPDLEFKFTINGVRYYKSPSARELDDTVGDIMLKITKRQSQIMIKLIRYVQRNARTIFRAIDLCAELDVLLAFYVIARDHNYVKPKMVETKIIDVQGARHPMLELLTTFVPNNIVSGDGRSLVKILTGPNSCGKSVYLKQVGLIVFMAHIGSYVPAKSATIGTVSHIFTQISPLESISLNASTFLQDLRQMSVALNASTTNSLVIIDEFGSRTTEVSGLSLLAAVINDFVERAGDCPHIFLATHIHRVLQFLPKTPIIENLTFEYVANDDKSLSLIYRLIDGNVKRSFAHSVLKSAGFDEDSIKRSVEVYHCLKEGTLPPPLPNLHRMDTVKHILERLTTPDAEIDLEELKSWLRQAMLPPNSNKN